MKTPTKKHGTAMYRRGCRCDTCVTTMREYRRQFKPLSDAADLRLSVEPLVERLAQADRLSELDPHRISQWRRNGWMVSVYWADKWAIKLGFHPFEVWGWDFYKGAMDADSCIS